MTSARISRPGPVYVEAPVPALPRVLVNGARRGLLVELSSGVFVRVRQAQPVRVASTIRR